MLRCQVLHISAAPVHLPGNPSFWVAAKQRVFLALTMSGLTSKDIMSRAFLAERVSQCSNLLQHVSTWRGAVQSFKFNDMEWSLWDRWILEGDLTVQQVLDWFKVSLITI